ncbi:MAG: glycosyltransferase [bacterium]|nr:glycosyltransferase [bacterium]
MKISIDAGGFCADQGWKYGNYTFTENLVKALLQYDQNNLYYLYSFCKIPVYLKLGNKWKYLLLQPRKLWMKFRVSLEEMLWPKNVFLGINQAVPMYTKSKIISFSHGLSYYYFPQYYRESFIRLSMQLTPMIQQSKYIVASSQKVKKEMKEAYPDYQNVKVIPFGIPFDMLDLGIKISKQNNPYFMYVGMNHPIKNIKFIISAFKQFRKMRQFKKYSLILIGLQNTHGSIKDHIKIIPTISRQELKNLYRNSTAYLSASLYESFNFPVLEALSQKCEVIALESAIIPEFYSYVTPVKDLEEFVSRMKDIGSGKRTKILTEKLKNQFSWKKYVKKLTKLYI